MPVVEKKTKAVKTIGRKDISFQFSVFSGTLFSWQVFHVFCLIGIHAVSVSQCFYILAWVRVLCIFYENERKIVKRARVFENNETEIGSIIYIWSPYNKTLHGGEKIWIFCSRGKNKIVSATRTQIHNFSAKCNIFYLFKTSTVTLKFLSADWLTGNDISAHIPLTTNIVDDTRQRKQLWSPNIAILLGIFLIK